MTVRGVSLLALGLGVTGRGIVEVLAGPILVAAAALGPVVAGTREQLGTAQQRRLGVDGSGNLTSVWQKMKVE